MRADTDYDVIIVGGGPVGLLLGNFLGRGGIKTLLVEQSPDPPHQSMAIGITPPSLDILARINLDKTFINNGIRVDHACVFEEKKRLGELYFNTLKGKYPFILSLPQSQTVHLLEQHLKNADNISILRNCRFVSATEDTDTTRVQLCRNQNHQEELTTRVLIGCDGFHSSVRRSADIPCVDARTYPVNFAMADFHDRTDFGHSAHLYFNRSGSVESFPLPNRTRRWILQWSQGEMPADVNALIRGIKQGSGTVLAPADCGQLHMFRAHRYVCRSYFSGNIALCGDSAHVMSPIGGQGMNTGFADAELLAGGLTACFRGVQNLPMMLRRYDQSRRKAFTVAANRAARGMWIGTRRGRTASFLRGLGVSILLNTPLSNNLPPYFAMQTIPGRSLVESHFTEAPG